ncbi:MAG: hypothetical protein FD130_343 [Halothiobacillaceae bacterium]|nr:MAG: hypothetical protein FD130_343 [Halothiobacillaceae bacterium]
MTNAPSLGVEAQWINYSTLQPIKMAEISVGFLPLRCTVDTELEGLSLSVNIGAVPLISHKISTLYLQELLH